MIVQALYQALAYSCTLLVLLWSFQSNSLERAPSDQFNFNVQPLIFHNPSVSSTGLRSYSSPVTTPTLSGLKAPSAFSGVPPYSLSIALLRHQAWDPHVCSWSGAVWPKAVFRGYVLVYHRYPWRSATDNCEEYFGGWWTKHLYTDSSLGNYAENTAVKSVDDEFSGRETAEIGRVYRRHCCRP
jgi:hypothetical protein